ncbi:MAG: hypothetical protein JEY99_12690 [Spirochaetales bacterium]|nr:hypothetical protein [Spirochaetales bacterium]
MKKRTFILLLLAAVTLYIIFFPAKMKGEMVYRAEWNTSLGAVTGSSESSEIYSFKTQDENGAPLLGYIGGDGKLIYSELIHYRAAVSEEGFINYSSTGGILVFQDTTGMVIDRLATDGFPLLEEGWFLIISRNRKGVSLMNWEGDTLWSHQFGSIITALDVNDEALLLGFLNGEVVCIGKDGEVIFIREHRDTVIYSCTLSSMEGGFAVVSGISPQKLILYTFSDDDISLLWERELEEEYRTSRSAGFSGDNKYIFLEESTGLVCYDLTGEKWGHLEFEGELEKSVFSGNDDLTSLYYKNSDKAALRISDFGDHFDVEFPFPSDGRIIFLDTNSLIASARGRIFRVNREVF